MLEYSRWKYLVILLVLVLSVFYAIPNAFPQDPAVQVTANRGAKVDAAMQQRVEAALKKASVPFKSSAIEKDGNLMLRTADDDAQSRAAEVMRAELGGGYVVALNQASTLPGWMQALGAKSMSLGLDLRGGVYFLMQVDREAALAKRFEATAEDTRVLLRDNQIRYTSVEPASGNSVVASLSPGQDISKVRPLLARDMPTYQINSTDDSITIRIPDAELEKMLTDAVQQNIGTLSNRINELGVAEPIIQRQGADRIAVQLPGVQDTAQAKRILGATATLEYRGVIEGNAIEARDTGNVPPEARIYYRKELGPDGKPLPILLNKRIITSGEQLQSASSFFDSQSGTPAVSVRLNSIGGQRMFEYSSAHVGKSMAVVYIERVPEVRIVDGKEVRSNRTSEQVISVATIQSTLGKDFQTTGLESMKEGADLALLLRAGALAAPMDFVDERTIGPSLGKENIERGLTAVAFSFIFALLFFLVYYRMFGLITCLALLINLLMVFALMSLLGATMSLPGLAGIALTVGMSVDANVLINERIREELRMGLPPQKAIAEGYDRASGTILDANVTAFLAGLAMAAFGTGPLRGFGITTMLGIATSAYTAVSVSRGIATLIYGGRKKLKSVAI
ncbi:protein translocase subunit SecD [Thermomonas carbonis]|uniref:Protein translocase subunit SecD n=1 Tax=Thermomonas carbonis TaxID=1463158 RepID=A0A7G9SQU4_9GAMM|nr:protein translocase subunit SecD [Thermomonas carbonis]QNN70219.1 protein translocase subunit SecD [Thermomonas carbonis]GHB98563.1 protein translocase subunit SecD [Thermomonas carbonis]